MSRGKRFESARRHSVHWHYDIEAFLPRFTTFDEGSELEHDDLASMHNCKRQAGLTFRALVAEGVERLELTRV
jgi:hypothetical protein